MTPRKIAIFLIAAVLAAVAGVVAAGWSMLRGGLSARDKPSGLEIYIARAARSMAIPQSAKEQKNPIAPTPEILNEARKHFADHCAICHGNDGAGKTEIGQNLYPKAPDMRLPSTQKLTDGGLFFFIYYRI